MRPAKLGGILLLLVAAIGCGVRETAVGPHVPDEFWEAYYIEGGKVGHSHTVVERIREGNQDLLRITSDSSLNMQRFGQSVSQRIHLVSVETLDGRLVRFQSRQEPGTMTSRGEVDGDTLRIETSSLGRTEHASIPWSPEFGGLFADQRSLRREPLQPGETRHLTALIPLFNQPGKIRLSSVGDESTNLLDGPAELRRIEGTLQIGAATIRSTYWATPEGEVRKSATSYSGIEQVAFRTTGDIATRDEPVTEFDLGVRSMVRVDRPLADPHATTRVVYRATLSEGDPSAVFVSDGSQQVRSLGGRSAEITVIAVGLDGPPPAGTRTFTEADTQPNNLIQSDDPTIVAMARSVALGADAWSLARALERYVYQAVRTTTFSQALASAAEVARSLEGDCTEHAVLLAALCRARELPARVAIGLVYFREEQAYAYHMWTEVWIVDRWIPLDATLGRGSIAAAHRGAGLMARPANVRAYEAAAASGPTPRLPMPGALPLARCPM